MLTLLYLLEPYLKKLTLPPFKSEYCRLVCLFWLMDTPQPDWKIIVFTVVVVLLLIILLTGFIISFVRIYQRRRQEFIREMTLLKQNYEETLLKARVEVQESTLSTLSKELHDNIGQLLSTAKMLLGITERSFDKPPDTLTTANETIGKAIGELRSLSKVLDKEWLEQFDLVANLKTEIERVNNAKALQIEMSLPEKLKLKADEQIILFRIIQEAIQNAVKHSGASILLININLQAAGLFVSVEDNGSGYNAEDEANGMGMLNIKHRASLLGGSVSFHTSAQGSSVKIYLPEKNTTL